MPPEPTALQSAEATPGPTFEDRVWTWVRIASEVVAVVWMIDLATHGDLSRDIRYHWSQLKAKRDWQRRFRLATQYMIFEAVRILEEGRQNDRP